MSPTITYTLEALASLHFYPVQTVYKGSPDRVTFAVAHDPDRELWIARQTISPELAHTLGIPTVTYRGYEITSPPEAWIAAAAAVWGSNISPPPLGASYYIEFAD